MRPLFLTVCLILLAEDLLCVTSNNHIFSSEVHNSKPGISNAEGKKGKQSGVRELTAVKEQSQGCISHNEACLENLNSIKRRSELEEEEERERLKELSATLDSLLVGTTHKRPHKTPLKTPHVSPHKTPHNLCYKRTKRATETGEIVLELDGKIKVSADFKFIEKLISSIKIKRIISWLFLLDK